MGGYGSGKRNNKKDTAEGYISFSINEFRRKGQWRYVKGTLTWWRGEAKRAAVEYVVRGTGITFSWLNQNNEFTEQGVPTTAVMTGYGQRYFFLCPHCGKRVSKLYAGRMFYCRHCYYLTYESCQESHSRFHARLGLSDKQYRNLFKMVEYERELKGRKRVGAQMLRRLTRYAEKTA